MSCDVTDAEKLADAQERLARNSNLIRELIARLDDTWGEGRRAKGEVSVYPNDVVVFDAPFVRVRGQALSLRHDPRAVVLLEGELPSLAAITEAAVAERDAYRAKLRSMADQRQRDLLAGPPKLPVPAILDALPLLKTRMECLLPDLALVVNQPAKFLEILDGFDAALKAARTSVGLDRSAARLRVSNAAASSAVDAALAA